MSHTYCPECGNFVQMDGRGAINCTSCGYNNEEELLLHTLEGRDDSLIGQVLDYDSVTEDFGL